MKITIDIESYQECPHFKLGPRQSTDGFDSGHDWICQKSKKMIQSFVEWYEESKVPIPKWCPFTINK